ncbi:unnamed protein product, partial [Scytosiphon promiscuus]
AGRAGGGPGLQAHWRGDGGGGGGGSEIDHPNTGGIDMHYRLQHHRNLDAAPTPSSSPPPTMLEAASGARRGGGEEAAGALAWGFREPRQGWEKQQQQQQQQRRQVDGINGTGSGVRTENESNIA